MTLIDRICKEEIVKKKYEARDGLTFCNVFVNKVSERVGCRKFKGLLANQIVDKMWKLEGAFLPVNAPAAASFATAGFLVIAGWKNKKDASGHVAVCTTGKLFWSNAMQLEVPYVASVGRKNFYGKPASFAFTKHSKPSYFVWIGMPHEEKV